MPRDQAFVDGYSFAAYDAAGFGRIDEQDGDVALQALKRVKMPEAEGGLQAAWDFLSSAGKLAPIPEGGIEFGKVPEGVVRLGGAFVVRGNEILYRWSEQLPGDHASIEEVWKVAVDSTKAALPSPAAP